MDVSVMARPAASDLAFNVFDRSVHPEFVDTLCAHHYKRDGWSLRLHLTPAGHYWDWRWKKCSVTEILSHQEAALPDNHQLFSHRLGQEKSESLEIHPQVRYQTCFQLERMPELAFFRMHDELVADEAKSAGFCLLKPHDRMNLSPLSFVMLQGRKGSIILTAFHTFPEEYAIAKCQTLIDFGT